MCDHKPDLTSQPFPKNLKWSTEEEQISSLDQLYQLVNRECDQAVGWYFTKKKKKKIYGYLFRIGAIFAVTISGVIPILSQILARNGSPVFPPGWATVSLAAAALFISLDRFGGCTSGWVRFIRTGQRLNKLQHEFKMEWEKQKLVRQCEDLRVENVKQAIDSCKDFSNQVNLTVMAETDQWAQDFQKTLQDLETNAKKKPGAGN